MGRLVVRSWVGCEGGCLASKMAKFWDFRRLLVVVLQWSRCVGGFFGEKMGSAGLLGVNSRVFSWFPLLVECTREREICASVLDGLPLVSPQVWSFCFPPLLGFCSLFVPMAEP